MGQKVSRQPMTVSITRPEGSSVVHALKLSFKEPGCCRWRRHKIASIKFPQLAWRVALGEMTCQGQGRLLVPLEELRKKEGSTAVKLRFTSRTKTVHTSYMTLDWLCDNIDSLHFSLLADGGEDGPPFTFLRCNGRRCGKRVEGGTPPPGPQTADNLAKAGRPPARCQAVEERVQAGQATQSKAVQTDERTQAPPVPAVRSQAAAGRGEEGSPPPRSVAAGERASPAKTTPAGNDKTANGLLTPAWTDVATNARTAAAPVNPGPSDRQVRHRRAAAGMPERSPEPRAAEPPVIYTWTDALRVFVSSFVIVSAVLACYIHYCLSGL